MDVVDTVVMRQVGYRSVLYSIIQSTIKLHSRVFKGAQGSAPQRYAIVLPLLLKKSNLFSWFSVKSLKLLPADVRHLGKTAPSGISSGASPDP